MDHIPLPKHPIRPPVRIPCVCSDDELYDGLEDFAAYPARAHWPELVAQKDTFPFWILSQNDDIDDERLGRQQKVLQAWVFFGLLFKLLAPHDLYHAHDYIDASGDPSQRFLHTRKLAARLQQWYEIVSRFDADRKNEVTADMQICLQTAQHAMLALNNNAYRRFDRMIKQSLAAICEAVEGALSRCFDLPLSFWTTSRLHVPLDQAARDVMLRNGWCISEIASAEEGYSNTMSGLWYIQHMSMPSFGLRHRDCIEEKCVELQIRPETYQPQHVDGLCECGSLGPDVEQITACLRESADFPVLEVRGNSIGEMTVSVHQADDLPEGTAYVAFSHVWADGLGNPKAMTLPQCQLLRLRNLVNDIQGRTFVRGSAKQEAYLKEERKLLLWCDTLCCPVDPRFKPDALAKMRAVYENAEYVLVLDRGLESYPYSDMGLLEAGTRILLSRWMKRLWYISLYISLAESHLLTPCDFRTYQEAILAKKLLIQFADGPIDLIQVMRDAAASYQASATYEHLYNSITAGCVNLMLWRHSENKTAWIKEAVRGLAYRGVSVESDEPLCIATVLGLDSGKIARTAAAQRMNLLWRLISQSEQGVAESLIFNTLHRLPAFGYRWAPVSFQQSIKRQFDMLTLDGDTRSGALTARGLRVNRSGWKIRREKVAGDLSEAFWPSSRETEFILPIRHPDGSFYNVFQVPDQGLASPDKSLLQLIGDPSKELFLILARHDRWAYALWTSQQKGVIVSRERHESGLSYCRSRMLVVVDRVQPAFESSWHADYIYSDSIRSSWTVTAFRLLVGVENLCASIVAWLPGLVRGRVASMVNATINSGGRSIGRRIRDMIINTRSEAPKLPRVAELLEEAKSKNQSLSLGNQIVQAVMGRYATITEVFGPETMWYVD